MGHHLTNLIFHMVNTILLFMVLELMTGSIWRSAFVAALFALHPLHVESVAWVSERKDVLSAFFGFLMIGAYYRYVKAPDFKNYALVIVFLSLGLMAKPMLVTFPFVLLLLDFWPLNRFHYKNDYLLQSDRETHYDSKGIHRIILEKIPLFIPVVISCVLTFFAQKSGWAVQALGNLSLKNRIANALVSYVNYVLKMFWPRKLSVFYPHPRDTFACLADIRGSFAHHLCMFPCHKGGKEVSVYRNRTILVCRNACARNRIGTGGRTGDGGSIHIYTSDRAFYYCCMGSFRSF